MGMCCGIPLHNKSAQVWKPVSSAFKNVVFLTPKRVIGRYVSCRTVQPSFTQDHTHSASGDVGIRWSCGSQAAIRAKSTTPGEIDFQHRCWRCRASRGRRQRDAPPSFIQPTMSSQTSVSTTCQHILQRERFSNLRKRWKNDAFLHSAVHRYLDISAAIKVQE